MALLLQEQDDGICPFKVKDHRETSVADQDRGSGAFLTSGSGMGKKSGSGTGINYPDHIFRELRNKF